MNLFIYSILTNFMFFCSGYIFLNQSKKNFEDYFYVLFVGLITLSFISLFFNFFFKLSPLFNSVIYSVIIFIFFARTKFRFKFNKRIFILLILSSISTFLLIIYSNVNRPDAGLYHLPYVSLLNENKIIFGISNIHSRFGHISILQYLSALNYNYLFGTNGVNIPLASVVSFFYIYFFNDVLRVIRKKDNITYANVFSLFIIIYISYKINRYSGFGNDAVAHLSFFFLVSYFLKSDLNKINLNKLTTISVFIFINKPVLGLVFLIPLFIFFFNKHYNIKKILEITFSPSTLLLFLWLLKNIFISGCMIYPLKATCIDSLEWTNSEQIVKDKISGSAWSKGWPDRVNQEITMSEYNKNFNWFKTWSTTHLKYIIKIISPFILILLLIVTYLKFKKIYTHDNYDKDFNIKINFLLFFCLLGLTSFILIFPIFRYGYSYLITTITLIIIYLNKKNFNSKKNIIIFKFFFIVCITALLAKQIVKINKNYEQKKIWPNIYTFEAMEKDYKKIFINNNFYYYLASSGDNLCMYSASPCTSYKLSEKFHVKKKFNYNIISLEHE